MTPWIAAYADRPAAVGRDQRHRPRRRTRRPTGGKTGTTSSEKDGYFVGFSSGLTTGVWYGRDDNRRIPGLAGGKNPAQAFHDFMAAAVANRPVEEFVTEVAAPEWQQEEAIEPIEVDEGSLIEQEGDTLPVRRAGAAL